MFNSRVNDSATPRQQTSLLLMQPEPNPNEPDMRTTEGRGFYHHFSGWLLLLLTLLAPGYLWMAAKVLTPGDMSAYLLDVSHWLPNDDSGMIQDMEKFSEIAGKERSNVIRMSWEGCSQNDRRAAQFVNQLRQLKWPDGVREQVDSDSIFEDVLTFEDVVAQMQSANSNLTEEQIRSQLLNVMIGANGTTCVVATLTTREPMLRKIAFDKIEEVCGNVAALAPRDLKYFGGPVYTRKIDQSGVNIATRFTPISFLIAILCTWLCIRRFPIMLAIFLNSVIGCCAGLVSLYISQVTMDPLLMLLPGFWFIMSISASLHFINYYRETTEAPNVGTLDVATRTVKVAFWPSFLATLTTCIGLSSLCTSDILPLWKFGFHASVGLACSFVCMYLFLPSFLHRFGPQSVAKASEPKTATVLWNWYENIAVRFKYKTALVFMLLVIVSAIGFSRLGFSNKLNDQFAKQTKINLDTEWFENQIGPVIPFELLVRFPKDNLPRPSECLDYVDSLQKRLAENSLPNKTISATAIVPYDAGTGARQTIRRAILDRKLERKRDALSGTGFVVQEEGSELWRLTMFAFSASDWSMNDYFGQILSTIETHQAEPENESSDATISFAGLGARMAVITRRLGGGLMESCFTSALLIALVVILALRSVVLGLTAMIPNIFPILFSFGIFGYFRPSLDIGSIMTASIAMGIAVDDTIHFMHWFRHGLQTNLSRRESVQLAIRRSGRAIASTSLICGLGFFVFFYCDFMPVARFGQLLFVMLSAALVGDLVFLPALLQSLPESMFRQSVAHDDSNSTTEPAPQSS